jgi:hypothetical protein
MTGLLASRWISSEPFWQGYVGVASQPDYVIYVAFYGLNCDFYGFTV